MEDEEGPRDPGADHPHLQGFTEHDFQGNKLFITFEYKILYYYIINKF